MREIQAFYARGWSDFHACFCGGIKEIGKISFFLVSDTSFRHKKMLPEDRFVLRRYGQMSLKGIRIYDSGNLRRRRERGKRKEMRNKKLLKTILTVMLAVCMFAMTACGKTDKKDTTTDVEQNTETCTVIVTEPDGNDTKYTMELQGNTLYDCLVANEFDFDGYQGDWGYFLTTVNGVFADYDADGAYWSLYVNGEYGQFSIDAQPVAAGDVFELKYEVYVAE